MKILKHPGRAVVVLAATAALFATLDLTLIPSQQVLDILPSVLVHVLVLTLIVGTWVYTMIEGEQPDAPVADYAPGAPRPGRSLGTVGGERKASHRNGRVPSPNPGPKTWSEPARAQSRLPVDLGHDGEAA